MTDSEPQDDLKSSAPDDPGASAVDASSVKDELLIALGKLLDLVDFDACLKLYGTMDGILATMLQSFPDRVITDPHLGPCFTASRLAQVRGVTRQAISKQRLAGKLFGVKHAGEWVFPSVQFDDRARMRPAFATIYEAVRETGVDPVQFAVWLHTPNPESGVSTARLIERMPDTRSATERQLHGFVPEMIVVTGKHSPRTKTNRRDA